MSSDELPQAEAPDKDQLDLPPDDMEEKRTATGGLIYANDEELKEQRLVGWEFLKSLPYNLLSGGNIGSISLPVRAFFEPRSYLERLTEFWACGPLLTLAAEQTSPLERLKYVAAFALGGLHKEIMGQKKPFNPILGETFEATFPDSTQIFIEQSSHHPPVSTFLVIGPNKVWTLSGHLNLAATMRANSVKVVHAGYHEVEFADGCKIRYSLPVLFLRGILYGQRVAELDGTINFIDRKNRLGCSIIINPNAKGFLRSLFSRGPAPPCDTVRAEIFRYTVPDGADPEQYHFDDSTKKEAITVGDGSWLRHLEFEGKKYWDIKDTPKTYKPIPVPNPMPSDCRFREDRDALCKGDWDNAQKMKHQLEEKQREEARWRKAGYAKRSGIAT